MDIQAGSHPRVIIQRASVTLLCIYISRFMSAHSHYTLHLHSFHLIALLSFIVDTQRFSLFSPVRHSFIAPRCYHNAILFLCGQRIVAVGGVHNGTRCRGPWRERGYKPNSAAVSTTAFKVNHQPRQEPSS